MSVATARWDVSPRQTPMYTHTYVFMMPYTVSQIKPPSSRTAPYVAYVCLQEHLFLCDNTAALKLTFTGFWHQLIFAPDSNHK